MEKKCTSMAEVLGMVHFPLTHDSNAHPDLSLQDRDRDILFVTTYNYDKAMQREMGNSKVCDFISVLDLKDWNWSKMPQQDGGISATMYHSSTLLENQMITFGGCKLSEDGIVIFS
jgi:hypothetical protein